MPKYNIALEIVYGITAIVLILLAFGFAIAFVFMIMASMQIDSEIIEEMIARKKDSKE